MQRYSRRTILAASLSPKLRTADATEPQSRYATPYKYGQLVLASSRDSNAFDSRSVDCPFVFQDRGLFYMTYIGWDGTGYQTGLASSFDLLQWRKLGLILARDSSSPITRYNVAMNWILREPALRSPGRLRKLHGRFLGVYHAYPNSGYESGPAVIKRGEYFLRAEVSESRLGVRQILVRTEAVRDYFYFANRRRTGCEEGTLVRSQNSSSQRINNL
jgi:hypothetical protein